MNNPFPHRKFTVSQTNCGKESQITEFQIDIQKFGWFGWPKNKVTEYIYRDLRYSRLYIASDYSHTRLHNSLTFSLFREDGTLVNDLALVDAIEMFLRKHNMTNHKEEVKNMIDRFKGHNISRGV